MKTVCLHDKKQIENFLRQNLYLHIYSIGDLDDFFWSNTCWYALKNDNEIKAIVLLYTIKPFPTLLAFSENIELMHELLKSISHLLPPKFCAHITSGAQDPLKDSFILDSHGTFCKMALSNKTLLNNIDTSNTIQLTSSDLQDILDLYETSPGNWFDPRMLETNQYFGIKHDGKLISVAGIHVYSPQYKIAALGNIVTDPNFRSKGFGKTVTACLCISLLENVDHVGLNVKADNKIAIAMYEKLGFEAAASYEECMIEVK